MKTITFRTQNYFRFQALILAFLGSFLTGGLTALLIELDGGLQWKETTILMVFLMSIPYPISFAWIWLEYLRYKRKTVGTIQTRTENLPSSPGKQPAMLSIKEQQVYGLIKEGKSNKEICSELFIEQSTLKSHINHIYKKLDIKSRKDAFYVQDSVKTGAIA